MELSPSCLSLHSSQGTKNTSLRFISKVSTRPINRYKRNQRYAPVHFLETHGHFSSPFLLSPSRPPLPEERYENNHYHPNQHSYRSEIQILVLAGIRVVQSTLARQSMSPRGFAWSFSGGSGQSRLCLPAVSSAIGALSPGSAPSGGRGIKGALAAAGAF